MPFGNVFFLLLFAVIFAAGASTVLTVAVVADHDVIQCAVLAVAIILAGGHFASDRAVNVHCFHLLSPIMRRILRVY